MTRIIIYENRVKIERDLLGQRQLRVMSGEEAERFHHRRGCFRTQAVLLFFMFMISVMMLGSAVCYLNLQSSCDYRKEQIMALEKRLERLQSENEALYSSIEMRVDMEEVRRIAVQELGMVHQDAENVLQYEKSEDGYVRHYGRIPAY